VHEELLTCREIASRFGVDQQAAMERIRRSGWPGFKGNDGEVRFRVFRWRVPPPSDQLINEIANDDLSARDIEYSDSRIEPTFRDAKTSQMSAIRSGVAALNEALSLIDTGPQPSGVTDLTSIKSEIDAMSGEIRELRLENVELWERLELQNSRIADRNAEIDCMERLLGVIDRFIMKASHLVQNADQDGKQITPASAIADGSRTLPPAEIVGRPSGPMNMIHYEQIARELRGDALRAGAASIVRLITKE